MRTRLVLAAALVACAAPRPHPPRGEQVFSIEGKVENGPFRYGKDDLPALPRRSFEAIPPWQQGTNRTRFEGVAIAKVLAEDMEMKRGADTAVFHGERGMLAAVPIPMVRQLRPVLADKVDGEPVPVWRPSAAPLQLAWPNLGQPGIDTDPRIRWWWIGAVQRIELQPWTTTYGKALRVPVGAVDGARLGAEALSNECIGCHRVRGVGGTRGPELTAAAVGRRDGFVAAMRQHLREVSGFPAAPEVTAATARSIAEFLGAVQLAGKAEEELEQPPPPDDDELVAPPGGTTPIEGGVK